MQTTQGNEPPVMELIREGLAVMRVENETQQQIAVLRPRDESKVLAAVLGELKQTPEFAKKVFYAIPFKDENAKDGKTWVEGISIGGSMAIQRRWGNSASACRVVDEKADRIITEGVFMDYESNTRVMRQVAVNRMYKVKDSNTMKPLRGDFLERAIASGMSKAVRNAVLHGIPEFIKIEYLREAKKVAGGQVIKNAAKPPLAERIAELLTGYENVGVSKQEIASYMGKPSLKEDDYEKLLGLLNALEEGYVKKESIFIPAGEAPQEPRDSVTLEDVIPPAAAKGKK